MALFLLFLLFNTTPRAHPKTIVTNSNRASNAAATAMNAISRTDRTASGSVCTVPQVLAMYVYADPVVFLMMLTQQVYEALGRSPLKVTWVCRLSEMVRVTDCVCSSLLDTHFSSYMLPALSSSVLLHSMVSDLAVTCGVANISVLEPPPCVCGVSLSTMFCQTS